MRRGLAIFIVIFLCLPMGAVWAQMISDSVVYDTVTEKSKFSYTVGARMNMEWQSFHFEINNSGNNFGTDGNFSSMAPGIFLQAEWRYFMLCIAPSYCFQNINIDREYNLFMRTASLDSPDQQTGRLDIQFLFRLPIIDRSFQMALYLGPEFTASVEFQLNMRGGVDFGFMLTKHHYLYLSAFSGIPVPMSHGTPSVMGWNNKSEHINWNNLQQTYTYMPVQFQFSLGLRIKVYKKTYYYRDNEVDSRY